MKIVTSRSSASVRSKPSCSNCRLRHLKCDRGEGECKQCKQRKLPCKREDFSPIMYRHSRGFNVSNNKSSRAHLDQLHVFNSSDFALCEGSLTPPPSVDSDGQRPKDNGLILSASPPDIEPVAISSDCSDDGQSPSCELQSSASPIFLESRRHAYLFGYFRSNLSSWFDITSKNDEFRKLVISRALRYRALLFAILTVSSKHLSLVNGNSSHEAEQFYDECLQLLIKQFNEPNVLVDENVFAAVVILRLYEELSSTDKILNEDCHLDSIKFFAQTFSCHGFDVGYVAFQVQLRQDLYSSIICSRPLKLLDIPFANLEELSDDDYSWANEICRITANIANYCFGPTNDDPDACINLNSHLTMWHKLCFKRFHEIFSYKDNDDAFLITLYQQPSHALAMECYHLAIILLTIHAPQLFVSMGSPTILIHKIVEKYIITSLHKVMGIALGSDNNVVKIMACPAIWVAGSLCTEFSERTCILNFLRNTGLTCHWPTKKIINKLETDWGQYDLV